MVVPSMSTREIYDSLMADRKKLDIKGKSLLPKIIKQFKKENKFPAWKWVEYTHQQSRNKYLIMYYSQSREQADKTSVQYVAFMEEDNQRLVIQWGCWPYRKHGAIEYIMTRSISFYCPHFFQRYRERVWNNTNISYNELLCRYFSRNNAAIPLELNESIQRNFQKYDKLSLAFRQRDGICFVRNAMEGEETTIGTPHDNTLNITVYYTIVTNSMLFDEQEAAIKEGCKDYVVNDYNSVLNDTKRYAILRYLNLTPIKN